MKTEAKFRCSHVEPDEAGDALAVEMSAITEDTHPDDSEFWSATPYGELRLGLVNPRLAAFFEKGGDYILTFTRARRLPIDPGVVYTARFGSEAECAAFEAVAAAKGLEVGERSPDYRFAATVVSSYGNAAGIRQMVTALDGCWDGVDPGEAAYRAFNAARDGVDQDGKAIPAWAAVGEAIREAWREAAGEATNAVNAANAFDTFYSGKTCGCPETQQAPAATRLVGLGRNPTCRLAQPRRGRGLSRVLLKLVEGAVERIAATR